MRISEYLPWIIASFLSLLFVTAVTPNKWSERTKNTFRVIVAVCFFFLIGAYWLATGEKFDETAYRLVLCKIHSFERCSNAGASQSGPDGESLERWRKSEQQLKDAADAIARLEAAQRAQERRPPEIVSPTHRADVPKKKDVCMQFNGRMICE